jgi:RND superfamily putative drug exporter
MRRFASWITSHRKTVIIGWIVGLIAMGFIAKSAGSDVSDEFSLPSSDSTDALDLLENRFPAQAGDTVQLVYKAEGGVETPAIKQKMEGVFDKVEALPHVSEVSSPYAKGGAGAVSEDGKIAYATAQFNVTTDKLNDGEVKKIMDTARGAGGDGLKVEVGGSPAEEVRGEEEESFSEVIGVLAAVVVLLISFGSVVAMGLPLLTALFALGVGISGITLFTHVFDTAEFAPQLAFMIGLGVGVDYALFILTRFRNGLDEGLD